jgi:hypothetical protein
MNTAAQITEEIMRHASTPRPWEPFVEVEPDNANNPLMKLHAATGAGDFKLYRNNKYQVAVYAKDAAEGWPPMFHLSFKRLDKEPVHDWRDIQRIKNELIGPENEAIEIYPAESRLVDTANQYHLFVFADASVRLPIGFTSRWVCEEEDFGTKQRPFPADAKPKDLKTLKQFAQEVGVAVGVKL